MKIYEMVRSNKEIGNNDNPEFEKGHKFDWRRYVPDELKDVWSEMSVESRVITKIFAEHVARQIMSRSE